MAIVNMTAEAQRQAMQTPRPVQARIADIVARLANWPEVSGAKPLRKDLAGNFRIRTGDYRVIFRPSADDKVVTIWKIGYRGDVYD